MKLRDARRGGGGGGGGGVAVHSRPSNHPIQSRQTLSAAAVITAGGEK